MLLFWDYIGYNEKLKKINQLKVKETRAVGRASCRAHLKQVYEHFSNEASIEQFLSKHHVTLHPQAITSP